MASSEASPARGSGPKPSPWWTGEPAFAVGLLAWLAVMILYWPAGLSFGDDVGYLSEAKLILSGRILPRPTDVGVWVLTPHGMFPKYPLLNSLLLLPFVAATPRAAFAVAIASAMGIGWIGSRVLKSWGSNPVWALLLIAHPTVVILARTVMADLPLSLFALGAWWAIRQRRRVATVFLLMALLATKATGFVLGLALAGGELLRLLPALRRRDRDAWGQVGTIGAGLASGFVLLFVTNELSAGGLWFAYDNTFLGTPPFWFSYFPKSAPAHLRTFLLLPPLLILGAIPFWRRREWGPLFLIFGFGTMMCFYFFVDFGTTWFESLILAPRLVLPIVTFLLVGYADLLSTSTRRILGGGRVVALALVTGTTAMALVISIRHHRWQTPMAEALQATAEATHDAGSNELGLTFDAAKAGTLFPGVPRLVGRDDPKTAVVLCSVRSASHRQPDGGARSCALPGYRSYRRVGDYEVLVREQPAPDGPR